MDLLANLARGPSFTLAVAGCFRGVVLHIVLAMAGSDPTPPAEQLPGLARMRAALKAVALIRMLDITPHAQG